MSEAKLPLRRGRLALLDLITMFLGVFLAFAFDNYREGLQERERERTYLEAMACELNSEIALTERTMRDMKLKLDRMERFFSQINAAKTPVDTLEGGLLSFIYSYPFIEPQSAAFNSMKSSGDLRLIVSDSIRFALVNLDKSREQVAGQGQMLYQFISPFREYSYSFYDYNIQKSRGLDRLRSSEVLSRLRLCALEVRSYYFVLRSHVNELQLMQRRLEAVTPCAARSASTQTK